MNPSSLSTLRIVVLAAGFSARLGTPKPLARVRGISLIRKTLQVLAPFATSKIVVIVPPRAARLRAELRGLNARCVANPQRADGLSSSVRCGLAEARYCAAALLLPVDLAGLERRDIARLIERWRAGKRRVAARRLGSRAATPLILPRWLFARAQRICGDSGLRKWLARLPGEHVALVDLESAARDVDTPQDLLDARRDPRRPAGKP